jgi:ubiquitin-like modifier-activating enzyme 5
VEETCSTEKNEVVHEDNDWGISLVSETNPDDLVEDLTLAKGIRAAYSVPDQPMKLSAAESKGSEEDNAAEISLDDLMGQLKNM